MNLSKTDLISVAATGLIGCVLGLVGNVDHLYISRASGTSFDIDTRALHLDTVLLSQFAELRRRARTDEMTFHRAVHAADIVVLIREELKSRDATAEDEPRAVRNITRCRELFKEMRQQYENNNSTSEEKTDYNTLLTNCSDRLSIHMRAIQRVTFKFR